MGHTFVDLYKKVNTKKESCVTTILKELFVEIELSVVWLLHLKYDHIRTLTALLRAERSWEYEHSMDLVGLLFAKLHKIYSWRTSLIQKTSTIKDWYLPERTRYHTAACFLMVKTQSANSAILVTLGQFCASQLFGSHWHPKFMKTLLQDQNYNGGIWLHTNSKFKLL